MITKKDNYAEWALLVYELDDAKEHLETLMREMSERPDFAEEDYRIHLGHIYSHPNRVWNRREHVGTELAEEQFQEFSRFPDDIEPIELGSNDALQLIADHRVTTLQFYERVLDA